MQNSEKNYFGIFVEDNSKTVFARVLFFPHPQWVRSPFSSFLTPFGLFIVSNPLKARIKTYELRGKSKAEIDGKLKELKDELSQTRVAQVTGGAASKLARM